MSNDTAETQTNTNQSLALVAPSPEQNTQPEAQSAKAEKQQVRAVLAEARNTREVLLDFQSAVGNGTFQGQAMLALAKGQAFLNAIIAQNKNHIDNLQTRLDGDA